jgi:hypothetical protein
MRLAADKMLDCRCFSQTAEKAPLPFGERNENHFIIFENPLASVPISILGWQV